MTYKFRVGGDITNPVYVEFTDAKLANKYIQNYLDAGYHRVVCVESIGEDVIELYFEIA